MRDLGLHFRLLMVALVATVVVLVAPRARAAVPMCGEHAETIAAPPIMVPSKNLVLDLVTPCQSDDAELGQAPSDAPRPSSVTRDDGPLRAWPSLVYLPSAPVSPAVFSDADVPALPAGFGDSVYRPPRAR